MNKENFIKVLNASLLMYEGKSAQEVEKINDKGAVVIAKLLNRFIVSYNKKNDDFKVKEDKKAPESKPTEELKEINKKVEQKETELTINESSIVQKISKESIEKKSSDTKGGVVEIKTYHSPRGRIIF